MIRITLWTLAIMVGLAHVASAQSPKPNIVVIMTDDQDLYWGMRPMAQATRRLAQYGVTFNNSFVSTPTCGPSRASFHTGQLTHNHGIWSNSNKEGGGFGAYKNRQGNTLGPWLQAAGYKTAFIGKLINAFWGQPVPGWNKFIGYVGTGYRYFDYELFEDDHIVSYGSSEADYSTDVFAGHALDFIDATSEPFFLMVAPISPHAPTKPAPRHAGFHEATPMPNIPGFNELNISDKSLPMRGFPRLSSDGVTSAIALFRRRQESLMSVDDLVEQVVSKLEAKGLLDNTYIVLTSDNGFALGKHRWVGKQFPYDVTSRVPLVIRGPGIPANAVRNQSVLNIDVTATILEWAGATSKGPIDGKSLKSVLAPGGGSVPWRSGVLLEARFETSPKYPPGYQYAAVRTPKFLYVEYSNPDLGTKETELYDIASDPNQTSSIIATTPLTVRNNWAARLAEMKSCRGATCSAF